MVNAPRAGVRYPQLSHGLEGDRKLPEGVELDSIVERNIMVRTNLGSASNHSSCDDESKIYACPVFRIGLSQARLTRHSIVGCICTTRQ
jgi:hypothetical protein